MEEGCRQAGCAKNSGGDTKSRRGTAEKCGRGRREVRARATRTRKCRAAIRMETRAVAIASAKFAARTGWLLGSTGRATKGEAGGTNATCQRRFGESEENCGRGLAGAQ